jgi:hypothetical protein
MTVSAYLAELVGQLTDRWPDFFTKVVGWVTTTRGPEQPPLEGREDIDVLLDTAHASRF